MLYNLFNKRPFFSSISLRLGLVLVLLTGTLAVLPAPMTYTAGVSSVAPVLQIQTNTDPNALPDSLSSTAWSIIQEKIRQTDYYSNWRKPQVEAGQVAKIIVSDGAAWDRFGWSVAVSADLVVVGAGYDDDKGNNSGSAYVFERNQGGPDNWGLAAKLTAADGAADDRFGCSVAVSGDTVVVGAYRNDDRGTNSGSAYVFVQNQGGVGNWGQAAKLIASDGAASDYFGRAVAISGDTVVVGAWRGDDSGSDSGSAYVFERNQGGLGNWGQAVKLIASDGAASDYFGRAVAISGDTIVVGAWRDDDNGPDSGSAYVFERNHGGLGNWGQMAKLTASDGAAADYFGYAVTVSGDTVVVGAPWDDDRGNNSGSAYMFEQDHGGADNWGQAAKLTVSDGAAGDEFGSAVAIGGNIIIVGASYDDDKGNNSGSAYMFERNQGGTGNWGQMAKLTPVDGAVADYFGHAVAISGDTVVVGMPWDDDNGASSGSAYVYRWTHLRPDVVMHKTVVPTQVVPGDTITYTLTFFNAGNVVATDVVITDTMPVSMTNTSFIISGTTTADTGINPIYVWNIQDLGVGQGGIITIIGVLNAPLAAGTFTNTATIACAEGESDMANNSGSAGVAVANVAPVANAGPDQSVSPGALVTLDGSGSSDANGDALTYGWQQTGGTIVSFRPTLGQTTFTAPSVAGALTFSLVVTDTHGLVDTTPDEVVITIINVAPVANAGPDQSVSTGALVTLDGSGSSDANGDALTYGWQQTGGPGVALSSKTVSKPTFTAPVTPTVLTFALTVADSHGLADLTPDGVVITVSESNMSYLYVPLVFRNSTVSDSNRSYLYMPLVFRNSVVASDWVVRDQ